MQSFKTSITFGLVFVPVTLHSCVKENTIAFNTLYKKTGERIRYEKTCDGCPSNISNEDIVKGYQYEKGNYVILTDEELEKIKNKKDTTIAIETFVKLEQIDPIYFDKSYFVKPTGGENAFALILKALESEQKVGIAKTVLGTKEQLVALRTINGQMVLNTMHFYDEIQESPVQKVKEEVKESELKLAKMVIDNMTEDFDPQKYKDEYREKLLFAIEDKINGKAIVGEKKTIVKPTNIINLMQALQDSVKKTNKAKPTKKISKINKKVASG